MKHNLVTLLIMASVCFSVNAQKTIAVLNGSNWTFYSDFSTALNQCPSSSTIYLPGGTFVLSENKDTINKMISIIGVGHYIDSTQATEKTILLGSLYLTPSASNSLINGIELKGRILTLGASNNNPITNFTISRCKIDSTIVFDFTANCFITESVLGYIQFNGSNSFSNNCNVRNSILTDMSDPWGGNVTNCVFVCACSGSHPVNNVAYYNNVFASQNFTGSCYGSNNLFLLTNTNTNFINSLTGTFANTFVNVPSNSYFSYNHDYHLLATSVGHNGGNDGMDVGIYGTAFPFKPSAVPANPHISTKSISPSSAPNGTLPVNIRVIAQDR